MIDIPWYELIPNVCCRSPLKLWSPFSNSTIRKGTETFKTGLQMTMLLLHDTSNPTWLCGLRRKCNWGGNAWPLELNRTAPDHAELTTDMKLEGDSRIRVQNRWRHKRNSFKMCTKEFGTWTKLFTTWTNCLLGEQNPQLRERSCWSPCTKAFVESTESFSWRTGFVEPAVILV